MTFRAFRIPKSIRELAASRAKLIVMHAVQGAGRAKRVAVEPAEIFDRVIAFFEARIAALTKAGIARDRLILDPGMGFFWDGDPEASLRHAAAPPRAQDALRPAGSGFRVAQILPAVAHRPAAAGGRGRYACPRNCFAGDRGADYIRTHDPGALRDALLVGTSWTLAGSWPGNRTADAALRQPSSRAESC